MQKARVAVVDDEATMRKSFARFLRAAGYDARVYASGQEFLDACRRDRPDCAIIDCQMPGLSGVEVLERLRRSGIQLPVAMFAASDDAELRCACTTLGAQSFLLKPADGAALLSAIRWMVRKS
jgi:FixJ family two-component response regulator